MQAESCSHLFEDSGCEEKASSQVGQKKTQRQGSGFHLLHFKIREIRPCLQTTVQELDEGSSVFGSRGQVIWINLFVRMRQVRAK